MNADALRLLLTSTWADPAESVAQRIFRDDAALPMLACLLDVTDAKRCAAIVVDVVRRRRTRKQFAVCLHDAEVWVRRADDMEPGTLVGIVSRATEAATLEAMLRGRRAVERLHAIDREFQGWTE